MGFWGVTDVMETRIVELDELVWRGQTAGEGLSRFDVVYRDGSFWKKSDSHAIATAVPPLGMARETVLSGIALDVWFKAIVSNGAWSGLISGNRVFLNSGGGVLTSSPITSGDAALVMGYAVGYSEFEFNPELVIQVGE